MCKNEYFAHYSLIFSNGHKKPKRKLKEKTAEYFQFETLKIS